jgi:hypothetical protein
MTCYCLVGVVLYGDAACGFRTLAGMVQDVPGEVQVTGM